MDQRRLHRRDVVKLLPMAMMGTVLAGFSRVLTACTQAVAPASDHEPVENGNPTPTKPTTTAPTDGAEFVPAGNNAPPPVNATEGIPTVPNQAWESRVKQLNEVQLRLYGVAAFSASAPGVFAGKERSHVPQVTSAIENGMKKVTVLVQHVMGSNALPVPEGGVDAAPPPPPPAMDAGAKDAASDAAPAPVVDSGPPPVHYITTMYLIATVNGKDTVVGLWEFASTDPAPPSVKFTLPAGVTQVVAYENCTLHGIWKTDVITV